MDYRHTEAFARQMEAAERRARGLRREAVAQFWLDVGRWLRSLWQRGQAGKVHSEAAHPAGRLHS
jgi:hypothetical protein